MQAITHRIFVLFLLLSLSGCQAPTKKEVLYIQKLEAIKGRHSKNIDEQTTVHVAAFDRARLDAGRNEVNAEFYQASQIAQQTGQPQRIRNTELLQQLCNGDYEWMIRKGQLLLPEQASVRKNQTLSTFDRVIGTETTLPGGQ